MYPGLEALVARTRRIAVIGDTQETAWVERLVGFEQNAHLRPALIAELVARRPDGVVHLGDLVTFGSSRGHWERLDRELAPLRAAGIPLLPVVGNHDRMLLAPLGGAELRRRFAVLSADTYYRVRFAELELVMLDTNLVGPRAAAQERWLVRALAEADADPAVRAVVACWHHPPITNSLRVSSSRMARERLLPPLRSSPKAIAVFSGHCHAFEHFRERGLDLFVSGGGGGPRHPLETRPDKLRGADLFPGGRVRFLHFLELEVGERALTVRVVRMTHHRLGSGFDIAATVSLAYR